jgi:hypothetical protein
MELFKALDFCTFDAVRTAEDEVNDPEQAYQWYDVDPDVMYPQVIQWLTDKGDVFNQYIATPLDTLALQAMNGDEIALFVLRGRTTCNEVRVIPDWSVALWDREGLSESERDERGVALMAAYHFFTEVLHQAVGKPLALHVLAGDKRWKV